MKPTNKEVRAFGTQAALDIDFMEFIQDLDDIRLTAYTGFQSKTYRRTGREIRWVLIQDDADYNKIAGLDFSSATLHKSLSRDSAMYVMSRIRGV